VQARAFTLEDRLPVIVVDKTPGLYHTKSSIWKKEAAGWLREDAVREATSKSSTWRAPFFPARSTQHCKAINSLESA
jgi:hypothetical protein